MDKSISLRSRITTLFREEGVTVVNIFTAIGMTVSTIVLAIVNPENKKAVPVPPKPHPHPDPELPGPEPPKSTPGQSIKHWIKNS